MSLRTIMFPRNKAMQEGIDIENRSIFRLQAPERLLASDSVGTSCEFDTFRPFNAAVFMAHLKPAGLHDSNDGRLIATIIRNFAPHPSHGVFNRGATQSENSGS